SRTLVELANVGVEVVEFEEIDVIEYRLALAALIEVARLQPIEDCNHRDSLSPSGTDLNPNPGPHRRPGCKEGNEFVATCDLFVDSPSEVGALWYVSFVQERLGTRLTDCASNLSRDPQVVASMRYEDSVA